LISEAGREHLVRDLAALYTKTKELTSGWAWNSHGRPKRAVYIIGGLLLSASLLIFFFSRSNSLEDHYQALRIDKEAVVPFVRKHAPSSDLAQAQRAWDQLCMPGAPGGTITIPAPKDRLTLLVKKNAGSHTALVATFPLSPNGRIWVPPQIVARLFKPDKPVSAEFLARLGAYFRTLSAELYARGDCYGLLQFESGTGMIVGIKEGPKYQAAALFFKTQFLPKGSYNMREVDSRMVLAWPEGTGVQTSPQGKTTIDGWSTFLIDRCIEDMTR